jgi:hypothetical protein
MLHVGNKKNETVKSVKAGYFVSPSIKHLLSIEGVDLKELTR